MHLIKKPERPRQRPFISSLIGRDCEQDWLHFIQSTAAFRLVRPCQVNFAMGD